MNVLSFALGRFDEFESDHPGLVAIDSQGQSTGRVMDLCEFRTSRLNIPPSIPPMERLLMYFSPVGTTRNV